MTRPARRLLRGPAGRRALVVALAVTALVAGAVVVPWPSTLVPGARAAGPATTVVVTLDPEAIPADGQSDTTATATVTDAEGNPVVDEEVKFTVNDTPSPTNTPIGDPVEFVTGTSSRTSVYGPTSNGDGTYKATIGYTRSEGPLTVTATATKADVSGSAELTRTPPGPVDMYWYPDAWEFLADGVSRSKLRVYVRVGQFVGSPEVTVSFRTDGDMRFSAEPGGTPQDEASCTTPIREPEPFDPDEFQPPSVDPDNPTNPDLGSANDLLVPFESFNGTCSVDIIASNTVGYETIRGTASSAVDAGGAEGASNAAVAPATTSRVLREQPLLTVTVDPDTVQADGVSTIKATAMMKTGSGPIRDEPMSFRTSGDTKVDQVINHGDGTYTAVITASKTAGTEYVVAIAERARVAKGASFTELPGTAAGIRVELEKPHVQADGSSKSAVRATVTDVNDNPMTSEKLNFVSTGDVTIGAVAVNGNTYTAPITASTTSGLETIKATLEGSEVTGSVVLTEWARPATTVTVTLSPASLPANGTDTTTVRARVTDVNGNPVLIENVVFTSSGDAVVGPTTDHGDGTYTATVTASKRAGPQTITALAGKATAARGADVAGSATLTQR